MNLFNPVQDVVQLLCLVQYARFVGTVFDPSAGCKEAWPLAAGVYMTPSGVMRTVSHQDKSG